MTTARKRLMDVNTREESDTAPSDPWETDIFTLLNDIVFLPDTVSNLTGGILYSDISGVDPGIIIINVQLQN